MGAALIIFLVGLGALAAGILVGRYYVPDDRMLKRTARASRSYMRALNHLIARDHDTVVDELRRVVEENIEDPEPYFALGALFRSRGEHERAIRVHQALAVREAGSRKLRLRARYELGLDFRAAGMPRRATRAMEDCLVEEPKHEGALRALCGLYEEQGRYAEAAAVWARLARLEGAPAPRREHHLLVAAAQRAIAAQDLDSAKRLLRDARKIAETPHFFAVAAELAAARHNPRAASARVQQALVAAPDLARFLVPGLVEAERQLVESHAGERPPRADARDAAIDAELDGAAAEPAAALPPAGALPAAGTTTALATVAAPAPPAVGTGEPGKVVDVERTTAERAVAALRDVLARASDHPGRGHLQLAIAELEAVYDPASALTAYRTLAAQAPDLLPARVAAARLALAGDAADAVRAELEALAGPGGALAWAFDGSWRCGGCGLRWRAFFWRCAQCRRWGAARLDVGREAQEPPRSAPRERRELPRVAPTTLLGAAATEALPEPTLEHGLSDAELERAGARPSVLGRIGGWFSGRWSGKRDGRR
jgi:lipopolysaccharide biosynthesis regulator YciM